MAPQETPIKYGAVLATPATLNSSPKGAKMGLGGQEGSDMSEWLPKKFKCD